MSIKPSSVLSVSQLNQQVKQLLEHRFPAIWVEGEISNLVTPGSGHWYFSLKDEGAQVSCAIFRANNARVRFAVQNGLQVLVKARVSLYPPRGNFQLIVEEIQKSGVGKLKQQFEALKKTLLARGWFDEKNKQPIPAMPKTIGVITSPTGAAIRDIIRVLQRRFCTADVIIYPTLVQGEKAAAQISKAIKKANTRNEVDVLLLSRGGGSLEDLWAFNEEQVAKSIVESHIPIITGVGHQIDFTIADFVSDLRAATPSAAAEVVTPDQQLLLEKLQKSEQWLTQFMTQLCQQHQQSIDWLNVRLEQAHPQKQLDRASEQLTRQYKRLLSLGENITERQKQQLTGLVRALNAVNPLNILERGYAVVKKEASKTVITDVKQVNVHDRLNITLRHGRLTCQVTKILQ
jgi:exodeoxyribonuclease VII large subunit